MEEIKVGATVRVNNPDDYLSAFAKKITDRDGVVEEVGAGKHSSRIGYAKVRFLKRNGRGKEFTQWMYIRDLTVTGAA
jgi:hypothetical protein